MLETEVERQQSYRTLSISEDQLFIDASHDPDLSYMFDVEGSINVPTFQGPSSDPNSDEKPRAIPLHRSTETHRVSLRPEHTNPSSSKSHTDDGLRSYICGTKWSINDPDRLDFDDRSVQTAPVQELSKPKTPQTRNTETCENKSVVGRNNTSLTRQNSGRITVSGTTMREGRYKLRNGGLVAAPEPQRGLVRRDSQSSLVSELTTDIDDDLSVHSAWTFQTWRSSNDGSTEPTAQPSAKARIGRWWRRRAPEGESPRRRRTQNSGSINAHVGRFKMKNGKFIPVNDSNVSKDCSIDAMAEAVRRAAAKSQRNIAS